MKKIKTIELEKISGGSVPGCGTVGAIGIAVNAFASTFAPYWNSLAMVCWDN
ncbi:hypothetical protein [Flavobacterium circumlabens]|uniref:Bacteriocin n=1 Tax=Flavobacterium circumlabens TaxID=2133765 RepID=A0ABY2B6Y7_9FLAO|nr:hypothetical protein [Flavobacterium circumlabens]TCN61074.1 hypothetical protein EV142_101661 [Flavobacterium circumlabens]